MQRHSRSAAGRRLISPQLPQGGADRGDRMGKKVLIADDEPNIVTALEFLLQRNGYEVTIAPNGDEALLLIEQHLPDLVLLDVMMPLKSGYEVCQRVRERPDWRHIKIIMLTAKGRDVEMSKGLSIGADLYITKPFSTQELMTKINGLLGVSTT
jgi:DNA-binding response OmpR family regulator